MVGQVRRGMKRPTLLLRSALDACPSERVVIVRVSLRGRVGSGVNTEKHESGDGGPSFLPDYRIVSYRANQGRKAGTRGAAHVRQYCCRFCLEYEVLAAIARTHGVSFVLCVCLRGFLR